MRINWLEQLLTLLENGTSFEMGKEHAGAATGKMKKQSARTQIAQYFQQKVSGGLLGRTLAIAFGRPTGRRHLPLWAQLLLNHGDRRRHRWLKHQSKHGAKRLRVREFGAGGGRLLFVIDTPRRVV